MSDLDPRSSQAEDANFFAKLPTILWERRWWVIVPTIVLAIAGVAAAFLMPTVYESRSVVLVESQSLPGQVSGGSDGEIDRQIAKIRQQLMSRPDLVELIQTHNLYDASSNHEPLSKLVEKMRDSTDISAVDANISPAGGAGGRQQSSIAFALSFKYPRPDLAQLVAQTFTDRLLKLSATQNQDEAQNSVRLLEEQSDTLQKQLSGIEGKITAVTGQNGAAIAASQALGISMAGGSGGYEGQIAQLQRENAQLRNQTGTVALERDPTVIAAEAHLAAMKAQYSDDHPDVLMAQSQLAAARANAKSTQSKAIDGSIQQQINTNNISIAQMEAAKNADRGRAEQMAAAQARGPAAAAAVSQLQAEAASVRGNLDRVNSALLGARSTAKLTEEQRGDRLTLIEPPVRPDRPSSPNRPLLAAGGVAAGIGLGIVLAFLLELMLRPIRSAGAISKITGAPPLAVVPKLSSRVLKPSAKRRFPWSFRRRRSVNL